MAFSRPRWNFYDGILSTMGREREGILLWRGEERAISQIRFSDKRRGDARSVIPAIGQSASGMQGDQLYLVQPFGNSTMFPECHPKSARFAAIGQMSEIQIKVNKMLSRT